MHPNNLTVGQIVRVHRIQTYPEAVPFMCEKPVAANRSERYNATRFYTQHPDSTESIDQCLDMTIYDYEYFDFKAVDLSSFQSFWFDQRNDKWKKLWIRE